MVGAQGRFRRLALHTVTSDGKGGQVRRDVLDWLNEMRWSSPGEPIMGYPSPKEAARALQDDNTHGECDFCAGTFQVQNGTRRLVGIEALDSSLIQRLRDRVRAWIIANDGRWLPTIPRFGFKFPWQQDRADLGLFHFDFPDMLFPWNLGNEEASALEVEFVLLGGRIMRPGADRLDIKDILKHPEAKAPAGGGPMDAAIRRHERIMIKPYDDDPDLVDLVDGLKARSHVGDFLVDEDPHFNIFVTTRDDVFQDTSEIVIFLSEDVTGSYGLRTATHRNGRSRYEVWAPRDQWLAWSDYLILGLLPETALQETRQ